jgi:hypothetical protein
MIGQPVPNLEDPSMPLTRAGGSSRPACFAPVAAAWLPRRQYAGTYDGEWQRKRAPYLPLDFNSRFFACAAPELTFDRFLQGSEPVEVHGATPDAPLSFTIPAARFRIEVKVGGAIERPVANFETVLIEPDENRLCLTWRASLPCDRKALKVEKVKVTLQRGGGA